MGQTLAIREYSTNANPTNRRIRPGPSFHTVWIVIAMDQPLCEMGTEEVCVAAVIAVVTTLIVLFIGGEAGGWNPLPLWNRAVARDGHQLSEAVTRRYPATLIHFTVNVSGFRLDPEYVLIRPRHRREASPRDGSPWFERSVLAWNRVVESDGPLQTGRAIG